MKITKKILSELFVEYNKLYFNNELITPEFATYSGCNTMGIFSVIESKVSKKIKLKISISRNVNYTEDDLKNVLVHEMIHLYVYQKTGKNKGHNKMFCDKMKELNKTFGLDIRKTGKHLYKKTKNPSFFKMLINKCSLF